MPLIIVHFRYLFYHLQLASESVNAQSQKCRDRTVQRRDRRVRCKLGWKVRNRLSFGTLNELIAPPSRSRVDWYL